MHLHHRAHRRVPRRWCSQTPTLGPEFVTLCCRVIHRLERRQRRGEGIAHLAVRNTTIWTVQPQTRHLGPPPTQSSTHLGTVFRMLFRIRTNLRGGAETTNSVLFGAGIWKPPSLRHGSE